jgi:spore maturation protein CgeB
MRMRAFRRLGHNVQSVHTAEGWHHAGWGSRQLQRRLERGGIIDDINRAVLEQARAFRPELVWAEKQEFLRAETILQLARLGARTVHFTPDPYFSLSWKRTHLMDVAISQFDALVYCKSYERLAYESLRKPLVYMPLGYCDEVHRPLPSADARWRCSVGFVGGWEPRRERLLHALAATGMDVRIWGGYWGFLRTGRWSLRQHVILRRLAGRDSFNFHRDELLARAHQGDEIYGDDYARALSSSGVGVGFLRTVCPDQHTTRTFEIPACGSMLLADRTEEHQALFEEGLEAEYFGSEEEFLAKATFYGHNEGARRRVAMKGLQRCADGGYAYVKRLARTLKELAAV